MKLYNAGRAGQVYGARSADPADASEVSETRALYRAAQKLLHFSSTPQTVLAALLCLANLERSNIITVGSRTPRPSPSPRRGAGAIEKKRGTTAWAW